MKNYIKYGLYSALAAIFFSLLTYVTGVYKADWFQWAGLISILIPIYFISAGIKDLRTNQLNSYISYGKAFGEGLRITLISNIIFTIYNYFYVSVINTAFFEFQKQKTYEKFQEQGMDEEQIEKMMKMSEMWMNPTASSLFVFLAFMFLGVVICLIAAAILKKDNPEEIS